MVGFILIIDVSRKKGGWTVQQAQNFLVRAGEHYGERYPGRMRAVEADRIEGLILAIENDDLTWILSANLVRGGVVVETYSTLTGARHQMSEQRWDVEGYVARLAAQRAAASAPPQHVQDPEPVPESPSVEESEPVTVPSSDQGVDFFRLSEAKMPIDTTLEAARGIAVMFGRPPAGIPLFAVYIGVRRIDEDTYWACFNDTLAGDVFKRVLDAMGVRFERRDKLPGDDPHPRLRRILVDLHSVESEADTTPAVEDVRPPVERRSRRQARSEGQRRRSGLSDFDAASAARRELAEMGGTVNIKGWAKRLRRSRDGGES